MTVKIRKMGGNYSVVHVTLVTDYVNSKKRAKVILCGFAFNFKLLLVRYMITNENNSIKIP